jgi:hypothetical protein
METTALTRKLFAAAPLALLVGVVALKFGWKGHPDMDWSIALPLWTVAHLAYVLGTLGLGVVLAVFWRTARACARSTAERAGVDVLGVVGVLGTIGMLGQMIFDLIVGFRAPNRAGMGVYSQQIHDFPGVRQIFYGFVPSLQLTALALLFVLVAWRRQAQWWQAIVFLAGSLAIATQVPVLMVCGGLLDAAALIAVSRPVVRQPVLAV